MATAQTEQYPLMAGEELMSEKAHGTCEKPVQDNLVSTHCPMQVFTRLPAALLRRADVRL